MGFGFSPDHGPFPISHLFTHAFHQKRVSHSFLWKETETDEPLIWYLHHSYLSSICSVGLFVTSIHCWWPVFCGPWNYLDSKTVFVLLRSFTVLQSCETHVKHTWKDKSSHFHFARPNQMWCGRLDYISIAFITCWWPKCLTICLRLFPDKLNCFQVEFGCLLQK